MTRRLHHLRMSRLQPDGERAVFYSQEIDALIRDIRRLGKEAPGINTPCRSR
jgi:hypothetical protein